MLTDRMGRISTIGGGEEVVMGEEMEKGDRVGKSDLLDDGVCAEYQRVACLVEKRQEVHLGVVTLDGSVAGEEG